MQFNEQKYSDMILSKRQKKMKKTINCEKFIEQYDFFIYECLIENENKKKKQYIFSRKQLNTQDVEVEFPPL